MLLALVVATVRINLWQKWSTVALQLYTEKSQILNQPQLKGPQRSWLEITVNTFGSPVHDLWKSETIASICYFFNDSYLSHQSNCKDLGRLELSLQHHVPVARWPLTTAGSNCEHKLVDQTQACYGVHTWATRRSQRKVWPFWTTLTAGQYPRLQ